jgi:hypothetical protein
MIPYENMIGGKKYYIHLPSCEYYEDEYYRGTYMGKFRSYYQPIATFEYVFKIASGIVAFMPDRLCCDIRAVFYDPEIIKENAEKARQSMEKRALDIILKKLINEDFVP